MKYGLVIYNKTDNLGDDILSYAALRFLPQIDYYINREELDLFCPEEKEEVTVIMNGWYLHHKYNWPPSPYIFPLLIGIHLAKNDYFGIDYEYINGIGKEFFIESEPIGCRDNSTVNILNMKGIKSYFSGCLTLTLEKYPEIVKNNKIYLIDVPTEVKNKVMDERLNDIEIMSHYLDMDDRDWNWNERLERIENVLKKYQSAFCVITSRLHVALPCLALGTPVLLIYNEEDNERFSDYLPLLYHCTKEEFLEGKAPYNIYHPLSNKETYLDIRSKLIDTCTQFINHTMRVKENRKELPDVVLFRKYWIEKAKWQKQLLCDKYELFEKELQNKHNWINQQIDSINWLEKQIQFKESENNNLNNWIKERDLAIEFLEEELELQKQYIKELENHKSMLENKLSNIKNRKFMRVILKVLNIAV